MSDFQPTPPPIPPEFIPYAQATSPRPVILTTIGILSIVIGSLGILTNSCGMFQWVTFSLMRNTSTFTVPMPAPVVPMSPATSPAVATGPAYEVEAEPAAANPPVPVRQPRPAAGSTMVVTRTGGSFGNPFASISIFPAILSSVISVIQLAIGVYLLFAGIQLMRNMASSLKHHLRYAMIKIPVAIIGGAAGGWASYEMQRAIFSNTTSPGMPWGNSIPLIFGLISAAFGVLFSIAYPVFLLIALTRPNVRAHFDTMQK